MEDVSGEDTVKAYGAERRRGDEGEARLVRFIQSAFSFQMLGLSMSGLGLFVTAIAGLVILWYGGHRVLAGALTIGQLMFFYSLLAYLLEPLERLASVNLHLQDALVALDRLHQILDIQGEPLGDSLRVPFAGIRDGLELRGVTPIDCSFWGLDMHNSLGVDFRYRVHVYTATGVIHGGDTGGVQCRGDDAKRPAGLVHIAATRCSVGE